MRLLKEIGCGHAGNGNSHGDEEEKGGAIEMACVVVRFGGRFGANGGVGSQAGTVTGTFTVTVMGI